MKDCVIDDSKYPPAIRPGTYYVRFLFYTRANNVERLVLRFKLTAKLLAKSFSSY